MEKTDRWQNLVDKYGSEDAAREEMRRRASTSSRNKSGTGGFAKLKAENPDRFNEIVRRGGINGAAKRWSTGKNTPESESTTKSEEATTKDNQTDSQA